MSSPSPIIRTSSISSAWVEAFTALSAPGVSALVPLIVQIRDFSGGAPDEDVAVRDQIDQVLQQRGAKSIDTTARLIFPEKIWKRYENQGRDAFFERYINVTFPRLSQADKLNRRGTYFLRMLQYGQGNTNQLKEILDNRDGGQLRRSGMQLLVYDPRTDLNRSPYLPFPCLDYVAIATDDDGGFSLTAFYALHYLFDRGYGNYVGLARLGQFIAGEIGREFRQITCVSGVAEYGKCINKTGARQLIASLEAATLKTSA